MCSSFPSKLWLVLVVAKVYLRQQRVQKQVRNRVYLDCAKHGQRRRVVHGSLWTLLGNGAVSNEHGKLQGGASHLYSIHHHHDDNHHHHHHRRDDDGRPQQRCMLCRVRYISAQTLFAVWLHKMRALECALLPLLYHDYIIYISNPPRPPYLILNHQIRDGHVLR